MSTVRDIVEKFTFYPPKDISPNLTLTKTVQIDIHSYEGCYQCGNKHNNLFKSSSPWTMVQYCWACNHLNVVYVTDRMGGNHTDTIECYTDKS